MVLILGQSLMVTGFIVIVLHAISYCLCGNKMMYEKLNMLLHDPSWNPICLKSLRFLLFMVFEIQGRKLNYNNTNNNNNNQNNWKNKLLVISVVSDAIFTIF